MSYLRIFKKERDDWTLSINTNWFYYYRKFSTIYNDSHWFIMFPYRFQHSWRVKVIFCVLHVLQWFLTISNTQNQFVSPCFYDKLDRNCIRGWYSSFFYRILKLLRSWYIYNSNDFYWFLMISNDFWWFLVISGDFWWFPWFLIISLISNWFLALEISLFPLEFYRKSWYFSLNDGSTSNLVYNKIWMR